MSYTAVERTGVSPERIRTIVEQTMSDDDMAVAALLHGEIDVLDRVPPWHLDRLRNEPEVRVTSYRLPTVHVLIPNAKKSLPASREFRRALCYAIQRDRIVREVFLAGGEIPGFQTVSGPFPAGLSFSDPLRYAYNNQLADRSFEPRLGAVLATVAWSRILDPNGTGEVELTEMPVLVLAHPADPIARIACETIKLQLERVGFRIKLDEYTADDLLAGNLNYDLRYAELAVWEPLADVQELFGAGGLSSDFASPYLNAALRQLSELTNWRDVRAQMAEIHDIANHDLPLIPLWQSVNFVAYRAAVAGIGEAPVTLYQDVDRWRFDETAGPPETASVR